MLIALYLIALVPSFYLLGRSADLLLKSLSNLGGRIGLSRFVLGFIILGIATSSPEFFIAISSSLDNVPQLSLGNLLGGIVVIFLLIIGLQSVLRQEIHTYEMFSRHNILYFFKLLPKALPFLRQFLIQDLIVMAIIIFVPLVLIADKTLSRADGMMLVLAVSFYFLYSINNNRLDSWEVPKDGLSLRKIVLFSLAGLISLFSLSQIIVWLSEKIINSLNIAPFVFGLLLLSVGTNIPELTIAVKARKIHGDFAIGNAFGSAMVNIFIIGLLGILRPFSLVRVFPLVVISITLVLATTCLVFFLKTKNKIERYEGIILLTLYIVYLFIASFYINF